MFWRRWVREYLPILTIRRKWNSKSCNFKVGDLLIVMMKDMPRSHWPMGRVLERYGGSNDVLRVVKLNTASGKMIRTVSRLIINSHPLTGEGGCYVICNCNVANIDVVALYLSERLNNNLYFTLEKLFFSVRTYIFLFALFLVSQKKNSPNAATREKKANSLITRFFFFIKTLSLVNAYY